MTHELNDDPWLSLSVPSGSSGALDALADRLTIQTIENVKPLNLQLGAAPKRTVPGLAAWDLHASRAFELLDPENRLRAILESNTGEVDKMRRLTARMAEIEKGA